MQLFIDERGLDGLRATRTADATTHPGDGAATAVAPEQPGDAGTA